MLHIVRVVATSLLLLLEIVPRSAFAQCVNTATPSCGVYESCFAKYCPCDAQPSEYFRTYGAKYCRAFLDNAAFSTQGKAWRDSTLSCLQESVIPHLDISSTPKCNCTAMRKIAFDSHVSCYTRSGASICSLPLVDVILIAKTVEFKEIFDADGWKQMRDVANICAADTLDDSRKTAWKAMAATLKLLSP